MKVRQNNIPTGLILIVMAGLTCSCAYKVHKYASPIVKDTQQPDKVLFDSAIHDLEHGRYEVARLTLNTLMNTYDQSEYMAKAKLALADSWYREGGSHAWAQAEAEYKDFGLFYPTMEEAAEAQERVCEIELKQMDKADRDPTHALRADTECRTLLTQYPNSKYAVIGQQRLREIQEVLAEGEYRAGVFYYGKGVYYSAANRLQGLADHYPLFSKSDQTLLDLGVSYSKLGARFRNRSADAFARLVRDYPLSPLAEQAKKRLKEMEKPIPDSDPVSLARQKYEIENRTKESRFSRFFAVFSGHPDISMAAKSGQPSMETLRPATPVSVPVEAAAGAGGSDVTASPITGTSALDTKPDARTRPNADQPPAQQSDPPPQTK